MPPLELPKVCRLGQTRVTRIWEALGVAGQPWEPSVLGFSSSGEKSMYERETQSRKGRTRSCSSSKRLCNSWMASSSTLIDDRSGCLDSDWRSR